MNKVVGIIVAIVLVAVAAFLVVQAVDNDNNNEPAVNNVTNQQDETADEPDKDNMLSLITDDPGAYYGKKVTVAGEIQDLQSQRVFKISDQAVGDELLVLTPRALTESQAAESEELFEDNADVKVTGTLRQLEIADVEREFDVDLTNEIEVEFKEKPVLIADNFTFSDNNAVFDFTDGPSEQ